MAESGTKIVVVYVHPKKGQSPKDCKAMAEDNMGAFSYDAFGTACWSVFGKAVQINQDEHSIEEGFRIVNLNFNASGSIKSVANTSQLPGQKELGYLKGV